MPQLDEQKKHLRAHMADIRKSLTSPTLAQSLCDLFLAHDVFTSYQRIAAYWPLAGELDIRPLIYGLQARQQQCLLPVVIGKDKPLQFRCWNKGDALVAGLFGTSHPLEDAGTAIPDLVLVPLLAFDGQGGRLGFGGGFYDRTLERYKKALRVGVAYDEQEVDQVPMDGFDQRMDWIVTPTRVIQIVR